MTNAPILIDKKTAAALLGISIGMLNKLARRGDFEFVRLGSRALVRRDDIERLALTPRQRRALDRMSGSLTEEIQ